MWFRRDLRLSGQPGADRGRGRGRRRPRVRGRSGVRRMPALRGGPTSTTVDVARPVDPRTTAGPGSGAPIAVDPVEVIGATRRRVRRRRGVRQPRLRTVRTSFEMPRWRHAAGPEVAHLRGVGSPYAVDARNVRKGDGSAVRGVHTVREGVAAASGWDAPIDPGRLDGHRMGRPCSPPPMRCSTDPIPVATCRRPARRPPAIGGASSSRDGLDGYAEQRNLPALDGTSRLSPALRVGDRPPAPAARRSRRLGCGRAAHTVFSSELAWRDFYADVLFQRPESAWQNLNRRMDAHAGRHRRRTRVVASNAGARARPGSGIVDAGMRQLAATGWMHNRVRMIVASFLVKDLHLPWQWGARWFMQHLVDGDLASNNHGWQWAAGTGTDAAPYFRVFNPTTQQERFDPTGEYVATWAPEPVPADARSCASNGPRHSAVSSRCRADRLRRPPRRRGDHESYCVDGTCSMIGRPRS